ncbi:MAG: hypothetical protein GY795_19580 [Desulfobacterales bacterium]|nr:hypothetical protein [Desulfobacterales bacterium]
MSYKKAEPNHTRLPEFDPKPSGKFVSEVFRELDISGTLIGRLAVWAWLPNTEDHAWTKDFDVAVSKDSLYRIRKFAAAGNVRITDLSIGGVNVYSREKDINVDFIDRSSDDFGDFSALFEDAIDEAAEAERTVAVGNEYLPLVSAEHLIAMKMVAHGSKDEEDIRNILRSVSVDIAKLRYLTGKYLGPLGKSYLEVLLSSVGHEEARSIKYKKMS